MAVECRWTSRRSACMVTREVPLSLPREFARHSSTWELRLARLSRFRGEHTPQHFSHHRLRKFFSKLHTRRHLVWREPFTAIGAQLILSRRLVGLQHDPRFGHFALDRILDPGDTHFVYGGMCGNDLLDLPRPDLKAAGLDHVLLPIDEEDVAVTVHVGEVARVQPLA